MHECFVGIMKHYNSFPIKVAGILDTTKIVTTVCLQTYLVSEMLLFTCSILLR